MDNDANNLKESTSGLSATAALSSDDEFDMSDVVFRRPPPVKAASTLLEDGGDGSLADLLGTTPPRSRIRSKERRRNLLEVESKSDGYRTMKDMRRNTAEDFHQNLQSIEMSERLKKRASLKLIRSRERDWKQTGDRESRSDSLTSPPQAYGPNLVESCSRFMSLASRLKCQSTSRDEIEPFSICSELPKSRVDFHNTFSMLIHMGNSEKGAKRTMSREEQVWQNEVADLIWLELQARLAQRSLTEQDAFLCTQRNLVATVLDNITRYRFVYKRPCKIRQKHYTEEELESVDALGQKLGELGCLTFDCGDCLHNLRASRLEVKALLESFYSAVGLFPSSHAMAHHHAPLDSQHFMHTLKAMILWYNMTEHLQFTMSSLSKLIRAVKLREERRKLISKGGGGRSKSPIEKRESQVRFNVECSDGSSNSCNSQGSQPQSDRGSDCTSVNTEQSIPSTPEPQSSQHPLSSVVSAESGYTSAVEGAAGSVDGAAGSVDGEGEGDGLTVMAILGDTDSPYERYLQDLLKTQGVRRSTLFLFKIKKHVLDKVFMTFQPLEKDDEKSQEQVKGEVEDECENSKNTYELKRFGWWSPERIRLSLPSYRCTALLVAAAALETVHAALTLRDLTQPTSPSIFTVNQIIHELKECLEIACVVRRGVTCHMAAALRHFPAHLHMSRHLLNATTQYDLTATAILQQYFRYLILTSKEKVQSRASWESESAFTRRLAVHLPQARDMADQAFTDIICNQIELQRASFMQKFEELSKRDDVPDAEDDDEKKRQFVLVICRDTSHVYARHRDATLQVAALSRLANYNNNNDNNPARAHRPQQIFNSLLSLTQCISSHTREVLTRSGEVRREVHEASAARLRELLLQLFKLGFELHKELYRFVQGTCVEWPRYTSAAARSVSLQPEPAPSVERRRRPETVVLHDLNVDKPAHDHVELHKELYRFALDASPDGTKPRASLSRHTLYRSESTIDEEDRSYDEVKQISIRQLLSGEASQDEPSHHSSKEAEDARCKQQQEWAEKASRCIIDYTKSWMAFVMERCDRGRGLRPRWASQGLDFLMLACDPHNTRHLSDEEFEELKQLMDSCISHVIGARPANPRSPPAQRPRPRLHSPLTVSTASSNSNSTKSPSELLTPPTPHNHADGVTSAVGHYGTDFTAFSHRVSSACLAVDRARENHLREIGTLGRVVAAPSDGVEHKLRQVSFPWQRGLKIGKGTFGKVYTVINTATGQLLAMKELSTGHERRALQRAANELTVLEGVNHPHLVRYYGCELHVEEMLIFMELCVEGSLEALIATSGALPEQTVRKYTKQLVSAVLELHRRKIAHRDIKSGNIFLTNEGHCLKLGDFGCAVKIRANTTALGELQGYVGTQAYMAPEVFMKTSGHGRAADIWSLGCVVTEMASGKRPFSEYDSNYSIMFVVGMGGAPAVPSTLSEEGASFCRECLTHEPAARPSVAHLQEHPFLNMSKSDEDCQCTTGYLITKPD